MSSLRFLPGLFLASLLSASPAESTPPPELHGILVTGQEDRFALIGSGGKFSGWCRLGDIVDGWTVAKHTSGEDSVVLTEGSRQVTVRLRTSTVGESATVDAVVAATVAEADDALSKMKFEALWERIVDEQKKGIVIALRQQTAADFAKAGLPPAEIDALLEKMGNAVVAGLQADVMRQDFARIYADVYTKEELRGMAAFCDTAAGKAWNAKQPDVQQKLMQVLMPRVMEGMPAAQQIAAEHFRQRAAAANAKPTP